MLKLLKIASLFIVIPLASCGSDQISLKLAHAAPLSDIQQEMSVFFRQEVEARSHGEIEVKIFPQGQLGSDKQMIDATRAGIVDISMVGLNNWTGLLPEAAAFTLPYMFPTRKHAYRVLDGAIGQDLLASMARFKIKGLGFPENGYRNITNNRGPIRTPDDLKGLRMRVNTSRALSDMFKRLQANPQQIPVAELYSALETRVVDAQDHPTSVTLSFKFYEVQKYFSLTQHAYSPLLLAMNQKNFENLSPDHQAIILSVSEEAIAMQRKLNLQKEQSMIAELEALGMTVNQDVDTAALQTAVKPVWDDFIAKHGDELITQILAHHGDG